MIEKSEFSHKIITNFQKKYLVLSETQGKSSSFPKVLYSSWEKGIFIIELSLFNKVS